MKNKIFILSLFLIFGLSKLTVSQSRCKCPSPPHYNIITLLNPADSAVLTSQFPVISWKDSTDDSGMMKFYQLYVNGSLAKDSISLSQTTLIPPVPIPAGKYTWSIAAKDTSGNIIAISSTWTFFIDFEAPAKFQLISPANGDTSTLCTTEFVWHAAKGLITKYKFYLSGLPSVEVAPTDTVLNYEFDIPDGVYQWFVAAYDMAGNTTNSDTLTFVKNGKVNTVWGYVQYDNNFNTKMSDVALTLYNYASDPIAYTVTDKNGYYSFTNLGNGSYSIAATTKRDVGGIDPTDALLINRNYIKVYTFTDDLKKTAADVNASKNINPIDALQVNRFYIKTLTDFVAGKWLFSDGSFIVNCDINLQINIRALCVGDVNGSFKPTK